MNETQSNPALAAAENYEKNVVTYTTGPFATFLIEQANPQPGERAVDVACGTGVVARKSEHFLPSAVRPDAEGDHQAALETAFDGPAAAFSVGAILTPRETPT